MLAHYLSNILHFEVILLHEQLITPGAQRRQPSDIAHCTKPRMFVNESSNSFRTINNSNWKEVSFKWDYLPRSAYLLHKESLDGTKMAGHLGVLYAPPGLDDAS